MTQYSNHKGISPYPNSLLGRGMDRSSAAEGFPSPPSVGQPEYDRVEDGESDSEGEDTEEEEKKSDHNLSLGTSEEYVYGVIMNCLYYALAYNSTFFKSVVDFRGSPS